MGRDWSDAALRATENKSLARPLESRDVTCFDRLRDRIRSTDGLLSVGLNPDPARLPDDCREYDYPRRAFNRRIVDATRDRAAAYSVAPARYADRDGWTELAETLAYVRGQGVPVVLDGRYSNVRGTPRADLLDSADAVTVSPFSGRDALAPVLDRDLGVFVVCRTPNSGASDLQDRGLDSGETEADQSESGETVAERVATLAAEWADEATADVGLLVGGPTERIEAVREAAPQLPFFVVGGARNDPEVAEHATAESGDAAGVGLVEVTREVIYAGETAGRGATDADAYATAARQAAGRLSRQLNRER